MAKKKKYGRMERFYAFLVSVLCISAAIIVAALVIQSRMDQGRDVAAQPASVEVSPSGTVGPLTLKALDTASTATATAAASATPAPVESPEPTQANVEATEPPFDFLPVISKADTDEKVIAITLDDCSHLNNVRYAALAAQEYGAKLTLFPFGQAVMKDGMEEILNVCVFDMGFEVENRTWSNALIYRLSDLEMCTEIWSADIAVDYVLNMEYDMHFFRMRGGSGARDTRTHAYLKQLGYDAIVTWTVSGTDSSLDKLQTGISPGNIYLFNSTEDDVKKMISFMKFAQEQGYRMVTLNELLGYEENACQPAQESILTQTLPMLENYENVYVQLKVGDRAWQVFLIQSRLVELGYLAADGADGVFGESTSSAISKFQAQCGLMGTGVATTQTQIELFADDAPKNPDPAPTVVPTPSPTPAAD